MMLRCYQLRKEILEIVIFLGGGVLLVESHDKEYILYEDVYEKYYWLFLGCCYYDSMYEWFGTRACQ